MSINPYSLCPCGSGKQFKWCCQNYYSEIEKAQEQFVSGQKAVALSTIDKLVEKHPNQPQVWTTRAQLYYGEGKTDEADAHIARAIELDPNFAPAYFLKASFRMQEDEEDGALILLRKCAEVISPKATDWIVRVYGQIATIELELGRPVQARAAADLAVRFDPLNTELRQSIERAFDPSGPIVSVASRSYSLRPAPAGTESIYAGIAVDVEHGRFAQPISAIEKLTADHPDVAANWFNLGLLRAWSGNASGAVEALVRATELEADDALATESGALAEALRLGEGMEDQSDHVSSQVFVQLSTFDNLSELVKKWSSEQRLIVMNEGSETEPVTLQVLEPTLVEGSAVRATAMVAVVPEGLMIIGYQQRDLDGLLDEVRTALGPAVQQVNGSDRFETRSPVIRDLPVYVNKGGESAQDTVRSAIMSYFEERWVNQPLKALGGATASSVTSDPKQKRRLLGIVEFLSRSLIDTTGADNPLYDFNRLRTKLGLPTTGGASSGQADIDLLTVAGLEALDAGTLTDSQVEQAYRQALKLENGALASRFADVALQRESIADRYAYFADAIRRAREANNGPEELRLIDAADAADRASNEGRRSASIGLSRGRALIKQGKLDDALSALQQAISATPDDLALRSNATESLLGAGQAAAALTLAEAGLERARKLQQRDAEQQFLELVGAAKRKLG